MSTRSELIHLIKTAAASRKSRRGEAVPTPTVVPKAKDESIDPTAPIQIATPKPIIPVGKTQIGNSIAQMTKAISAVREMQIAMQTLSQNVIIDSVSGTMAYKPKDATQPGATADVKTSKKSFNDFIAEQYLGELDDDKKGTEWTKETHITSLPGKQKTQTDIYELDVVMDTLRRVGASTKEFTADGKWDFRTDNALRNIMGFAYALLQLEGDFGLENNIYTFDNWKNLNKILSDYKIENGIVKLSTTQKTTKAINITKHLKTITKLYNHFRQQVLARPEFRPTIEGKRSFDRYSIKGSYKDTLTTSEDQMSKSDAVKIPISTTYSAPSLPNRKLNYIPLKALRNKDEYIKWMVNYAGNTEALAIDIFNKIIKPKIELM